MINAVNDCQHWDGVSIHLQINVNIIIDYVTNEYSVQISRYKVRHYHVNQYQY